MTKTTDKKLISYLDKNFDKLIKREPLLTPQNFFNEKWEDSEEVPIYCRYSHISFLNKLSQKEKDLYLLKYSLKHLDSLVDFFCKNDGKNEIKNTLLILTISDWECYPKNNLCFSFYITYTYKRYKSFWLSKPFANFGVLLLIYGQHRL